MTNEDAAQAQHDQAVACRDSPPADAPVAVDADTEPRIRRATVPILLGLGLLALVAGGGWMWQARQRFAAEEAARGELNQLGALVTLDANRKHVQGVNLSLPAVREHVDRAMPLLAKLTYLEVLTLSGTPVTDQQMARVARCRNLTALVLKKTALGDAALAHISGLRKLTALYLNETTITTQGLKQLSNINSLAILDLSETAIEGDLAALAPLVNLQHLVLNGVVLSTAAAETLGRLPSLSRLSINGSKVETQSIEKLRQAKPGIRIDIEEEL